MTEQSTNITETVVETPFGDFRVWIEAEVEDRWRDRAEGGSYRAPKFTGSAKKVDSESPLVINRREYEGYYTYTVTESGGVYGSAWGANLTDSAREKLGACLSPAYKALVTSQEVKEHALRQWWAREMRTAREARKRALEAYERATNKADADYEEALKHI